MTESEWLTATEPQGMLEFLRNTGRLTDRKARLFAVSFCRHLWHLAADEEFRYAVEVGEKNADGLAGEGELNRASRVLYGVLAPGGRRLRWATSDEGITARLMAAARAGVARRQDVGRLSFFGLASSALLPLVAESAGVIQLLGILLCCIFGNPFRPSPGIGPSVVAWNDGYVEKIARRVYEERRFDLMPVLADALEEAGCNNQEMLGHCREQKGIHAKGCWVLDLLLQKE